MNCGCISYEIYVVFEVSFRIPVLQPMYVGTMWKICRVKWKSVMTQVGNDDTFREKGGMTNERDIYRGVTG